MITRTYKASTQAKAAQKMAAEGAPPGHVMGGQSWAAGGRSCAAQGFVVLGVLLLVAGLVLPPLLIVAVIFLVIGIASGRGKGELTVTWVPESISGSSPPPVTTLAAKRTVEGRLAELERLHASGTLTDDEYAAKRAAILGDI